MEVKTKTNDYQQLLLNTKYQLKTHEIQNRTGSNIFFLHSMVTAKVDETQWMPVPASAGCGLAWRDEEGVILSLQYPSKINVQFESFGNHIDKARNQFRHLYAKEGMGLVECEFKTFGRLPCLVVIAKECLDEQPTTYLATILVPMKKANVQCTLWSQEVGEVKVRERVVKHYFFNEGKENMIPCQWESDPYLPEFSGPSLRNQSDDRKYDTQFPFHALSLLRNKLDTISYTISLEDT